MTEVFAFTDLIGEPDDPRVRVRARFDMLGPEAGGRSLPIFGKYRPNHNFGDPENRIMYMGQIEIPDTDPIKPGSAREVEILFLPDPGLHRLVVLRSMPPSP